MSLEHDNWYRYRLEQLMTLLATTSPYGHEGLVSKYLPKGGYFDSKGNYIYTTSKSSKTLFCCHMDTVGSIPIDVKPIIENGIIKVGNKKANCLGGDDKCGMLCLLSMIDYNIPGTYIFHVGEEKGCHGARHIYNTFNLSSFSRAIEFDRRGISSVITEMGSTITCSDTFANAVKNLLNKFNLDYKLDNTGVSTDVLQYEDEIPEVTNLSVGFKNEHSSNEVIDSIFLINELIPSIVNIDWETLPIERDPKGQNKKFYKTKYHSGNDDYFSFFTKTDHYYNETRYSSSDNDFLQTNGDIINGSFGVCNMCDTFETNITEISVFGNDYLLCKDCVDILLNGWEEDVKISEEWAKDFELMTIEDLNGNNIINNIKQK